MYSDTFEFNSEGKVSWSPKRTIDDSNRNDTSRSRNIRKFGDFVDNHGWIQCRSKSYPNRIYFHNTHSGCNTWYRPISRYIDIPFISIKRVYQADDVSTNNIELLSVSDDEADESNVSAAERDDDKSLTAVPDAIARYYYAPQADLISNMDDSCRLSVDSSASECEEEKEEIDKNNNNVDEDIRDEKSDSETKCSPLCATNFLETELFVGENEMNTKEINSLTDNISSAVTQSPSSLRSSSPCYVYDTAPRLRNVCFEDQLINRPKKTCGSNRVHPGPRKIICDMYGVRTINYDLPVPNQVRAEVGVKSSTLSESDSDVSEPQLQDVKTMTESEWRDIEKNLHQPLLSDPSSSPSSRSDTNNSSTSCSTSSTACSCSTCT